MRYLYQWITIDFDNYEFSGLGNGRKFYGGIGIHSKKGRSRFHVAITNVATDINAAEVVLMFLIYAIGVKLWFVASFSVCAYIIANPLLELLLVLRVLV